MPEVRALNGGCHRGKVRYEVDTDLASVMSCNCSICRKRGALLTFVPDKNFKLSSHADSFTDYQFNKKVIHHLLCKNCGIASLARGTGPDGVEMVAVNVRCLNDVDLDKLTISPFDGRSL